MARFMRTDLGDGHSRLIPPAVVGAGKVNPPIQGRLFPAGQTQDTILKRSAVYRLSPPTVVTQPAPFVASPVSVNLTYSSRGTPTSALRPPTVIDLTPQTKYLSVNLAYSVRGKPKSILRKPTDTVGLEDQGRIKTRLAPSPTQARRAHPRLSPPTVIDLRPQVYYLSLTLAPSPTQARAAHSQFIVATVVNQPQAALGGVMVQYVRRPNPSTKSFLKPPAVVTAAVTEVFYGPTVTLVRIRPVDTQPVLRPPVVIDNSPQTVYLTVSLAYSRRGVPHSFLKPPTVVDTRVYSGPAVTLTYSRRGRPFYELRPPVVIDLRPQTYYLSVTLAYSRRGQAKPELRPPTVIGNAPQTVYLSVNLTYSRRGRPKSILRKPVVIDLRPQTTYLAVTLAYSRRGRAKSFLRKPVLAAEVFFGPSTTIARTPRKRTVYLLQPPSRIREPVLYPVSVTLARIRPPLANARLQPPAVVRAAFVAQPVTVRLARNKVPFARSLLKPPTVVRAADYFTGPQTTLIRIVPPPVLYLLRPPAVVIPFTPPGGEVCGTDEAVTEVCETIDSTNEVCGDDEPTATVTEESSVDPTIICGDDEPTGDVRGGDQQATGG